MPTRDELDRVVRALEGLRNGPVHNSIPAKEIDLARELTERVLDGLPINKPLAFALFEQAICGLTHHGTSYEDLALEVWSQWEVITEVREAVGDRVELFMDLFYRAAPHAYEAHVEIARVADELIEEIREERDNRRTHGETTGHERSGSRTRSVRRRCSPRGPGVSGRGREPDGDGSRSVREGHAGGDLRDGAGEDEGDAGTEGSRGEH